MKISVITPAKKRSKSGNWTTAARWARMMRDFGHDVGVDTDYRGEAAVLLVALHAWRSAEAVTKFRKRHPQRPVVVALTGTDVNEFQFSDPKRTLRSMELADALI